MVMLEPFMGSQLCHIIMFKLCYEFDCEAEWDELYLRIVEALATLPPSYTRITINEIKRCMRILERHGYIEQDHEMDEELQACTEEARGDARIKDPVKYCLKKGRGTIINKVRARPGACRDLHHHIINIRGVVSAPLPTCHK